MTWGPGAQNIVKFRPCSATLVALDFGALQPDSSRPGVTMANDLFAYLGLLLAEWWLYLTAGPFLVFEVAQRINPKVRAWVQKYPRVFSRRNEIAVILLGLFVAGFSVYRTEHATRLKAEQFSASVAQRATLKAKLEEFYVSVDAILNRNLPRDMTESDFQKYVEEANGWVNQTARWIGEHMGTAARARFLDTSGGLSMSYGRAINPHHNSIIEALTSYKQNLARLIESDAWDKRT